MAVDAAAAPAGGQPAGADHTKEWGFPPEKDGWTLSHNAIRNDMADLVATLNALDARLSSGSNLHEWEAKGLQTWWSNFHHNVHEHHRHEEELFFPEIKKKYNVPAKVSDDHATLMKGMDECGQLIKELSAEKQEASKAKVQELTKKFPSFAEIMKEHLLEEEEEVLPEYRRHFSPKEGKVIVEKILKDMKPMDIGWFLRSMTPEQMQEFAKNEGIPGLVAKFILFPTAPKYRKKYTALLEAVKEGKEPAKPKSILSCFGG